MFEIKIGLLEIILTSVFVCVYLVLFYVKEWQVKKLKENNAQLETLNENLQEICNYDTMKLYKKKVEMLEDRISYYQKGLARRSDVASED